MDERRTEEEAGRYAEVVRRDNTGEDATEVVVQEGRARSGERVNEEVRAVDEGRHEDEESTVAGVEFVTTKSLTGRIFNFFISENYKFAKRLVKPNGKGYFVCSYPGCKTGLRATYTPGQEDPEPFYMDPPDAHRLPDGILHPIQVYRELVQFISSRSKYIKPCSACQGWHYQQLRYDRF